MPNNFSGLFGSPVNNPGNFTLITSLPYTAVAGQRLLINATGTINFPANPFSGDAIQICRFVGNTGSITLAITKFNSATVASISYGLAIEITTLIYINSTVGWIAYPFGNCLAGLASIPNLIIHYRGSAGITKDGSDLVSQWTDEFGANVVQPTGSLKPTFTSGSGWSGRAGLIYTGTGGPSPSTKQILNGSLPVCSGYTFVVALRTPNTRITGGTQAQLIGIISSGIVRWGLAGLANDSTQGLGWAGTGADVNLGSSASYLANTDYLMVYTKTATQWQVWVNGTLVGTIADTSMLTVPASLSIGAEQTSGTYACNNTISVFAVYSRVLTSGEIASLSSLIP